MCAIMGFSTKKLDKSEIPAYFDRTVSRGPDMSRIMDTGSGWLCFHRLAIMGLTEAGMQPFELDGDMVVCNGELYGFRPLKRQLTEKGYEFKSGSDCEIILPLYREYGLDMFSKLDAEFAMIIYDHKTDSLIAARDPIGIRPLFYGYLDDGGIVFASEAKNLIGLCKEVCPFPPGHYYAGGKFVRYADLTTVTDYCHDDLETVCHTIRNKLIAGVDKRLDADAPLGFLLSGGLDSSLVCAISALVLGKKIRTFAIGMDKDAIDLKYAREVADYIGADHTEVYMTRQQVLDTLEEVISLLGTLTSPPSGPAWACTSAARPSMSRLTSGCCSPARSATSSSATSTPTSPPLLRPSSRRPKSGWMSCICTMCSGRTAASPPTLWRPGCPSATWIL